MRRFLHFNYQKVGEQFNTSVTVKMIPYFVYIKSIVMKLHDKTTRAYTFFTMTQPTTFPLTENSAKSLQKTRK